MSHICKDAPEQNDRRGDRQFLLFGIATKGHLGASSALQNDKRYQNAFRWRFKCMIMLGLHIAPHPISICGADGIPHA